MYKPDHLDSTQRAAVKTGVDTAFRIGVDLVNTYLHGDDHGQTVQSLVQYIGLSRGSLVQFRTQSSTVTEGVLMSKHVWTSLVVGVR